MRGNKFGADLARAGEYPSVLPLLGLLHAARSVMRTGADELVDVWATERRLLQAHAMPGELPVEFVGVEFPTSAGRVCERVCCIHSCTSWLTCCVHVRCVDTITSVEYRSRGSRCQRERQRPR